MTTLAVGLLGPVEVAVDGAPVGLAGVKQRAVLAVLALQHGQAVPVHEIVAAVWEGDASPRAEHSLQQHVSSLRKLIEPARSAGAAPVVLVTQAPGYLLRVTELDTDRFEAAVEAAQRAAAARRWDEAVDRATGGLHAWRGPALGDLRQGAWFEAVATRFDELRLVAHELRMEGMLATGRHLEVVPEAEALARANPFRERFWGQLMLALYRAGRQADALAAYRSARSVLVEELGIEPSAELRQLEQRVLDQSPALLGSTDDLDGLHATYRKGAGSAAWIQLPDGQMVTLGPGSNLIGRAPEARVRLQDSRVSRRHASVERSELGDVLRDLESANGTAVGGAAVRQHVLVDGDEISVGGVPLRYHARLQP